MEENNKPIDLTKKIIYCGYGISEEEHKHTLWDFTQGFTEPEEDDELWEHIRDCGYCLTRVVNMQRAIKYVEEEYEKGFRLNYKEMQKILNSRQINDIDIHGKKDK